MYFLYSALAIVTGFSVVSFLFSLRLARTLGLFNEKFADLREDMDCVTRAILTRKTIEERVHELSL